VALVGLHQHDTTTDLQTCCKKLLACKLWSNHNGGMWRHSVKAKELEVLLVSQFTLYGTLSKKNQPDYKLAMKSEPGTKCTLDFLAKMCPFEAHKIKFFLPMLCAMARAAQALYGEFVDMVRQNYEPDRVKDGVFGAMMDVALVNDGPVRIG